MFFFPAAAIIALAAPSTPSKYDTLRQLISIGAWLYVLTIFIRNHRRIRTETEQSSVVR
jgi:hypothetical protein